MTGWKETIVGGLIGALLQQLFQSIFGAGVEAVGKEAANRRFRQVIWLLTLLLFVWIAVSSALLWTTERLPAVSGVLAYVQAGGPVWQLATPLIAAFGALWLLVPVRGKHAITFFVAAATLALTLASLADFQGGARYAVNLPAVACLLATFLLAVFGIVLSLTDVPPLDAPLARIAFTYWGRYRHLRALREYGRRHGWSVSGPGGKGTTLTLIGAQDAQHPVTITSSANYSFIGAAPAYILSAKMGSPRDIIAFRISREAPPKKLRGRVLAGVTRGASGQRKRAIHFYVVPHPDYPIPDGFLPSIAETIERGRKYLQLKDFAHATPFGIRYTHLGNYFGLTVRDAQMDPVLEWMRELIALLEPVSPGREEVGSRAGSAAAVDSAP